MSDSSASPDFLAYDPPPVPTPRKASWTPDQLARIDYEWRRLQRNFAYHPAVRVVPLEGEPPSKYEFQYQLRTLAYDDAAQIDYVTSCGVTVELPNAFPHAAPVVRPVTALFHPNVSLEAQQVAIYPEWTSGDTLEDVLLRVGAMLTFEAVDLYAPWNPVAMQWMTDNAGYVPTDSAAPLAPEADGLPLERIIRGGPATLKQLRAQVREICGSMLEVSDPPTGADVREFAQRVRMAVSLFTPPDVPAELSSRAVEAQSLASQLPVAAPAFEALRSLKAHVQTALAVDAELTTAESYLTAQLTALDRMITSPPPADPYAAMRHLPSQGDLQMALEVLRGLLTKADQKLTLVRQWLPSLREPARQGDFAPVLLEVLEAEARRLTSAVIDARTRLQVTSHRCEPVLDRTRREIAALEQLLQWKEFSDLTEKGHALVMRAEGLGAAGLQAYFVKMGDEEFGPFELEQQVDLGAAALAVRNPTRRVMELVDLKTGRRVAAAESGQLQFNVPGESPDEKYPATFRLTTRCDELYLPLDHVIRQTQALLLRASMRAVDAPGWCGRYSAALAGAAAVVTAEHRAAAAHWVALLADLKAVAAFKERLATYYLIRRVSEHAPQYLADRAASITSDQQASQRIGDILARSSKDMASGQIIMPERYHQEYGQRLDQRDAARERIAKLDKLLDSLAGQIRTRLSSRVLAGAGGLPALAALGPLPDELVRTAEMMGDDQLALAATELQSVMQIDLLRTAPVAGAAPGTAPAAPPALPAPSAPPARTGSRPPPPPPAAMAQGATGAPQATGLRRPPAARATPPPSPQPAPAPVAAVEPGTEAAEVPSSMNALPTSPHLLDEQRPRVDRPASPGAQTTRRSAAAKTSEPAAGGRQAVEPATVGSHEGDAVTPVKREAEPSVKPTEAPGGVEGVVDEAAVDNGMAEVSSGQGEEPPSGEQLSDTPDSTPPPHDHPAAERPAEPHAASHDSWVFVDDTEATGEAEEGVADDIYGDWPGEQHPPGTH